MRAAHGSRHAPHVDHDTPSIETEETTSDPLHGSASGALQSKSSSSQNRRTTRESALLIGCIFCCFSPCTQPRSSATAPRQVERPLGAPSRGRGYRRVTKVFRKHHVLKLLSVYCGWLGGKCAFRV
eukprot:scaffold123889_cov33-Tisochrysis_lutea.AAC.1